ncbi:MAG: cytochrome c maturation protein CcmE [Deltaproteobacteria bacterium]|nr:cytochrome c maturation protein CcmE [Deltaproteobacteria bacterium]
MTLTPRAAVRETAYTQRGDEREGGTSRELFSLEAVAESRLARRYGRGPGPLALSFRVSDGAASVPVTYNGVPPDLFKEGTGVVLEGKYTPEGVFRATLIMAKHSEEYRPPEKFEKAAAQKLYQTLSKEPEKR